MLAPSLRFTLALIALSFTGSTLTGCGDDASSAAAGQGEGGGGGSGQGAGAIGGGGVGGQGGAGGCGDTDDDGVSDCEEKSCGSDPDDAGDVCYACGWPKNDPGTLDADSVGPNEGDVVGNFELLDACGETVRLWDFAGEYHILFFTASW